MYEYLSLKLSFGPKLPYELPKMTPIKPTLIKPYQIKPKSKN